MREQPLPRVALWWRASGFVLSIATSSGLATLDFAAPQLGEKAGVGESTIPAQFRKIRDALDLHRMAPEWTLPGKLADNPLVWICISPTSERSP